MHTPFQKLRLGFGAIPSARFRESRKRFWVAGEQGPNNGLPEGLALPESTVHGIFHDLQIEFFTSLDAEFGSHAVAGVRSAAVSDVA